MGGWGFDLCMPHAELHKGGKSRLRIVCGMYGVRSDRNGMEDGGWRIEGEGVKGRRGEG